MPDNHRPLLERTAAHQLVEQRDGEELYAEMEAEATIVRVNGVQVEITPERREELRMHSWQLQLRCMLRHESQVPCICCQATASDPACQWCEVRRLMPPKQRRGQAPQPVAQCAHQQPLEMPAQAACAAN